MMDLEAIGIFAALASALCWAMGSILYERLGFSLSAVGLNIAKNIVGIALFSLILLAGVFEPMGWEAVGLLALSGVIGIALGDTFFFLSLNNIGAHALVLMCLLGQVLTVVFAVIFLGERPSPLTWVGVAAVVSGVTLVLWTKVADETHRSNLRGVVFGMLAVVCMAVGIVITKVGIEDVDPMQATFVRMVAGTLGIFLWGVIFRQAPDWTRPFRDPVLARRVITAVLVSTFGGFWLSHVAIKHLDVTVAGTLNAAEPLFVLPLAAIFLRERITIPAVLGSLAAIAGIVILFLR